MGQKAGPGAERQDSRRERRQQSDQGNGAEGTPPFPQHDRPNGERCGQEHVEILPVIALFLWPRRSGPNGYRENPDTGREARHGD